MPKGIAAHYLVHGDAASLQAIGEMADHLAQPWLRENNWANLFDPTFSEGREIARSLEALTQAIVIGAPSPDGLNYQSLAASLVDRMIWDLPEPDGSYPRIASGSALDGQGVDKPFMNGLVNEALINYYEQVEADPRIIPMIKKNLDY